MSTNLSNLAAQLIECPLRVLSQKQFEREKSMLKGSLPDPLLSLLTHLTGDKAGDPGISQRQVLNERQSGLKLSFPSVNVNLSGFILVFPPPPS